MNKEFLKSIGIEEENPNLVLKKLGEKEIELLDKRDLAETNGATERVQEIIDLCEKIKIEREVVKKEAESYVPPQEEKEEPKTTAKEQSEKKKEAFEKLMQKKKAEAEAMQGEVLTSANSNGNTTTPVIAAPNANATSVPVTKNVTTQQSNSSLGNAQSNQNTSSVTIPVASGTGEFSTGLKYYQKQDFANAFRCFANVAEDKNPADQKAVQERTQASFMLYKMYLNGQGTNVDKSRAIHYLKRAADFGYDQAQLEYGEYSLSQHMTSSEADLKARKEALNYIEKAANTGLVAALKKYVDFAINSADTDKKVIEKAKTYIPLLKAQVDSYESQQYDDFLKQLSKTEKDTKKRASYPKKVIIGELLFLLGTIYLFKGLNPVFFEEVIPKINRFIPNIPDWLIIKWSSLTNMTDPYMTHQGIFGCWLIILGKIGKGLGFNMLLNKSKVKTFASAIDILVGVLCVAHFVANIMETSKFFGNGGFMQVEAFVVSLIVGRVIGYIGFKIFK